MPKEKSKQKPKKLFSIGREYQNKQIYCSMRTRI